MPIHFDAPLLSLKSTNIIKIPQDSSQKLPSRGLVMIQGEINHVSFTAPLEPDGKGSHWFEVSAPLAKEAGLMIGEVISLTIEPTSEWMEPEIDSDLQNALTRAELSLPWESLTTKARWDWIRWIRSTKNPQTRQRRIDITCSKLQKGETRPCCFDRTRCTIPELSQSGVLSDSTDML